MAPGRRTSGGRRSQYDAEGTKRQSEGNRHCGSADVRGTRGYGSALPPAPAQMGQGKEDVGHGHGGEGSSFPDRIHPRDIPPSLLERVRFLDPWRNTDHYMVLVCLCIAPKREHTKYLTGRKQLTLRPPYDPMREDGIFAALRKAVPKPHARERRKNKCISEDTWILVNERNFA